VQSSSQTLVRRWRGLVVPLLTATALLLASAVAQASTNYTWTGAAPNMGLGSSNWSNVLNWEGAAAPSGSVGTLTFPALTSGACTANPATATCYTSTNDVTGLTVNAIALNEGDSYSITGNAITLGAGGITATAPAGSLGFAPTLHVPITLSAPQTWTISGGSPNLDANVTGVADTLAVQTSNSGSLFVDSDVEVGATTISGIGGGPGVSLGLRSIPASLNGTNGNPVNVNGGKLTGYNGKVGALTFSGSDELQVGEIETPAGGLTVNGGVTLDPTTFMQLAINGSGTTAGTDYSQLSASGGVNLAGASLEIFGGMYNGKGVVCPTLPLGTVDTLVTATGTLTGTFSGMPDGITTRVLCAGGTPSTGPWVRINYTAHAVTATVVEGSQAVSSSPTTTTLAVSNATPSLGEAVTYTATVTPEALAGAEPAGSVAFLDGGTPIGTCSAQPLTAGLSFSSASCTVSYGAAGAHTITATYAGEVTYGGSSSTAQTVTVHASSASGGSTGGAGGSTVTPTPTPAPPTGIVTVSSATITAQNSGKASVTLACTGTATCSGTLTLTAKSAEKGKKKRPKTTIIGTGKFSIPAGKSAPVPLTLNAAGRALLRADHGRLNATLAILTSSPAPPRTQHMSVHLAQRSPKARRR
jgi:Bacterial Ig-like domain (group 3)